MRYYRFYTTEKLALDADVHLDKAQSSHITRVLRLKVGQEITLFDGDGFDYTATINDLGKSVVVHIQSKEINPATPTHNIHLAQAMARGDRMDYAIQKAVEMGVSQITPLVTEFVQIRFDNKRLAKKLSHWQGVIISALEQCGRSDMVKLNPPLAFNDWLNEANHECLYLHPRTENQMQDAIQLIEKQSWTQVKLAIGPEGGFSDAEMAAVNAEQIIALGARILRTETAATAVLAILQHRLSRN